MVALLALAAAIPAVLGATAPAFVPAGTGPTVQSANYTGMSNGTLQNGPIVPGLAFDRFIQIWFENTDFAVANGTATFQQLAAQGILLDNFVAVTHPSEPNYAAIVGGDFWGMSDDNLHVMPSNISTIVDLLEAKNISWASYQENMPADGYLAYNYTQPDYRNASAPPYTFYVRKHNPLVLYDSIASVPSRNMRNRNFNDFAVDVSNNTLPQWIFITPNLVDDAHDTTIDYTASFIQYWVIPLLTNPNFNTERTLILITFDENDTYTTKNQIWSLLLGGAVPASLYGTTDSTFYSHYSCLSSVEANWGLGSLGRGDTNKTMSNVFEFLLTEYHLNYTNTNVTNPPLTNITGTIPGPLNPDYWVTWTAPDMSAVGAGGGQVFVSSGTNTSLTAAAAGAPVNLTALASSNSTGSGSTSDAMSLRVAGSAVLAAAAGALFLF
ncbi:hypothetical protein DACRYDRAFT_109841 [Dacryopinax primogenitus]|uniref:Phosphoesterase-domain-containing protein n=1 Tax=Dacryopinax primogenitus (strain DJM 731) TaxID=1858805 RepID=M5FRH6_DACPD|nr:uncharacterized protein DACRYDRAFT_109841 [Dacryopinax primogenitus]EJT99735.1 hypothetical protein DACRYDRAFT_109841 [Dacryopinax primogenitus]